MQTQTSNTLHNAIMEAGSKDRPPMLAPDSLRSQLETQKTQFLNEVDQLSREYYYADHMNAILGMYTELDERPSVLGKPTTFLNSFVRKDFSKSTSVTQTHVSNDFSKPVTTQTLPTNKKSILKNTNVLAPGMYKLHTDHTQTRPSQLPQDSRKTNKRVSFSTGVILTTSVSRPQLKSNPQGDRVMHNNSQRKKQEVEDHRRSDKLSKKKTSVTACNDSLNAKTLNVKYVSAMCDKCVLIDKHDMCVLKSVAKPLKETVASESNNKPRNFTRKLYEHVSKTCTWWYPKFTPSGYIWKPKSGKENIHSNASMPLGKPSRTANVIDTMTSRCSKHMTGNLKLLINFVEKVLGTTRPTNKKPCLKNTNVLAPERILHQTSVARTPEQNGVVKRRNRTLVEAARTMLSAAKSRAYSVFNKRTRVIMESIYVNFDELPQMASDQLSSGPAPECQTMALNHDSLSPAIQRQANVPQADRTVTMSNELDLLFSSMFDELLNESSKVVSKSSTVSAADAPYQRQHHTTLLNIHTTPTPTCQIPTLAPTVISSKNINQAETHAENDQVADDEFINIFSTPVQDQGEMSSRHVDSSNMHTFYQRYPSEHRWTKDHPLEQVIGNPSQSIRTRRQLEPDAKMCMFALT
nr:retrotransposon protein, putative, Ty1-copia subclass [Tanacetum cinerariifolium]